MAVVVPAVVGRSTGAPELACSGISPRPGHGGSGSNNPIPFSVNISSLKGGYTPGENYISEYSHYHTVHTYVHT